MLFDAPNRYRLEREIGRGRRAVVMAAEDTWLGRSVALKRALDPQDDALLIEEAQRLARIATPCVVQLLDLVPGPPVTLVLELLHGETLRAQVVRSGRLPLEVVDGMLLRMFDAFEALNTAGIVHGDVKPENIWITPDGGLKLLDVGATGDATALYAAPEVALGGSANAATDLYAAATVAWELLAGRLPFDATDATELALRKRTRTAPSLDEAGAPVPAGVEAWFARALGIDPEQRFGTARDAREAWRAAIGFRFPAASSATHPSVELYPEARRRVLEADQATRPGSGTTIVVQALPGAGASTFLLDVAQTCQRAGSDIVFLRRSATRRRTAWGDFRAAARQARRSGIALPALRPHAAEEAQQDRIAAALRRRANTRRVVLCADDPATCDGPTRRLILRLAADAARSGWTCVVTVPSVSAGRVAAVTRDTLAANAREVVGLESPDPSAWRAFLAQRLATADVSDALATHVRSRTHANPSLAVAVLQELCESGALRPADGGWMFRPERAGDGLPAAALRILGRVLAGLAPERRALLRVAALHGGSFAAPTVAQAAEWPAADVEVALHEIAMERRILASDAHRWRFVPPLLATLLCAELPAVSRRALHHRCAEILSAAGADDDAVGMHWFLAGKLEKALPPLQRAGQAALASGAAESAARCFGWACEAADAQLEDEAGAAQRVDLGLSHAQALHALAAWDAASTELDTSLTLARAWGLDAAEMRGLRAGGQMEYARSRFDEAVAHYAAAQECASRLGDEHELHELALQIGNIHFERGDLDAAAGEYQRTLAYATAHADLDLEARAANNVGLVESIQGRKEQAVLFFNRSLRGFTALGRGAAVARLYQNIGMIYLELANWAEARNFFRRCMEESERHGEPALLAVSCLDFAEATFQLGAHVEAAPALSRALTICRERGDEMGVANAMRLQAQLAAQAGDMTGAEQLLIDAICKLEVLGQALHLGQCWKDLGALRLRAGRRVAALQALDEAQRRFGSLDAAQHAAEVETLRARCREESVCHP